MTETATLQIDRAMPADIATIGNVLARAFHHDPVFAWVVPDPAARQRRLAPLFAAFAEVYLPHRQSFLAGDDAGAALWAPPGSDPVGAYDPDTFGKRLATVLGADSQRGFQIQELLDKHHPEEPCYYLQFMGVVPEQQGYGLGGRLLNKVLQQCNASHTPAYLEATSAGNRRLYERHGFKVQDEIAAPDGPPIWPMWREPAR